MEPETKWIVRQAPEIQTQSIRVPIKNERKPSTNGDGIVVMFLAGLVILYTIWANFFMGRSGNEPKETWTPMTNNVQTVETDSFGNVNYTTNEVNGMVNSKGVFIPSPHN